MTDAFERPPYRVPSMTEIAAIPDARLRVVSTFAGCGGSSLGYRMAGYRILLANEFVPAAADSYAANKATYTALNRGDIRKERPGDWLKALGLRPGDLDLFDGSPPCASFSSAGKRTEGWGKVRKYSDTEQRTDDLFFEYVRFVEAFAPKVFVAENVAGLARGPAAAIYNEVRDALEGLGYRVDAKVLDAQGFGVPQQRQRVIFQGVRADLKLDPAWPKPLPYRYSIRDALPWVVGANSKGGARSADLPSPTVLTHGRRATQSELTAVAAVEADGDMTRFAVGREWETLKEGEQSGKYFNLIRADRELPSPTILASHGGSSIAGVAHPTECRKFSIGELRRLCSFPDDFVLTGSYAQQWERLGRAVPPLMMRAVAEAIRDGVFAKIGKPK